MQVHSYMTPTFCALCGAMLSGLINQGVKCQLCGKDYHKKCVYESHNECPQAQSTTSAVNHDATAAFGAAMVGAQPSLGQRQGS